MYYINKIQKDSEKSRKSYGDSCCKICGESFTKYYPNQFLCSEKCQNIYNDILLRENITNNYKKFKKGVDNNKKTQY